MVNSFFKGKIILSQYISASLHLDKLGVGLNMRIKTTEAAKPHIKSILDNTTPMDPMLLKAFQKAIAIIKISCNPQGLYAIATRAMETLPDNLKATIKAQIAQFNFPRFLVQQLISNLTGNAFLLFYGLEFSPELLSFITQSPAGAASRLASLFQGALILQVKNEIQFKTMLHMLDQKKIEEILNQNESEGPKKGITVKRKESEFGRTFESLLANVPLISRFLGPAAGIFKKIPPIEVGLLEKLFEYPAKLSGGQKQRVAIARALVNSPELILCDEPTGNLDTVTGKEIVDLFADLNREQNITFVVVTHEDTVSQAANRVITIDGGKLVK